MDTTLMSNAYQSTSPFVLPLAPLQAVTLAADSAPRAVWVHEGRVWLTRQCSSGVPQDVWLDAGQSHTLPAGTEWVVEAWPQARLSVVQAAPSVIKRRGSWLSSWLSSWFSSWQTPRRGPSRLTGVGALWA